MLLSEEGDLYGKETETDINWNKLQQEQAAQLPQELVIAV